MSAPLGRTVGNAIETREAIEVLHGKGPPDLVECTVVLGAEMLVLGGKAKTIDEGRALIVSAIERGDGVRTMERMVSAQHGDARVVADPSRLEIAAEEIVIEATQAGFVCEIDALAVGLAGVAMGAGRTRADQPVDPGVGITIATRIGQQVAKGDELARLHVRSREAGAPIAERMRAAFRVGPEPVTPPPLVISRIDGSLS
jgi:pyrimidine-nucleoside phosphorylase